MMLLGSRFSKETHVCCNRVLISVTSTVACKRSTIVQRSSRSVLHSLCSALSGRASAEPSVPSARAIPAIAVTQGAVALLSIAIRGASEASCVQANTFAVLTASLFFLLYFWTTLTTHQHEFVAHVATILRPVQDSLLYGSGLATAAQLLTATWLYSLYPVYGAGALAPLYGAGYASLAVLVISQRGRRLKGRKLLEIEAGEGERHSIMAQGSRLAARNYIWCVLLLHLAVQTAAAGLSSSGGVAAFVQPHMATAAYGTLAVLYGMAGVFKFLTPALRTGYPSAAMTS